VLDEPGWSPYCIDEANKELIFVRTPARSIYHAELLDDGSIEITFAFHNGDEAILKAKRETSSTAC
jgi:hypothetical protein